MRVNKSFYRIFPIRSLQTQQQRIQRKKIFHSCPLTERSTAPMKRFIRLLFGISTLKLPCDECSRAFSEETLGLNELNSKLCCSNHAYFVKNNRTEICFYGCVSADMSINIEWQMGFKHLQHREFCNDDNNNNNNKNKFLNRR